MFAVWTLHEPPLYKLFQIFSDLFISQHLKGGSSFLSSIVHSKCLKWANDTSRQTYQTAEAFLNERPTRLSYRTPLFALRHVAFIRSTLNVCTFLPLFAPFHNSEVEIPPHSLKPNQVLVFCWITDTSFSSHCAAAGSACDLWAPQAFSPSSLLSFCPSLSLSLSLHCGRKNIHTNTHWNVWASANTNDVAWFTGPHVWTLLLPLACFSVQVSLPFDLSGFCSISQSWCACVRVCTC